MKLWASLIGGQPIEVVALGVQRAFDVMSENGFRRHRQPDAADMLIGEAGKADADNPGARPCCLQTAYRGAKPGLQVQHAPVLDDCAGLHVSNSLDPTFSGSQVGALTWSITVES